jgi:hypothetical protein
VQADQRLRPNPYTWGSNVSYDVSVSVAGSTDEESDEAQIASPEGEDLARLEHLLGRLRGLDPSAEIEEERKQGVLCGFAVVESERLPYIEMGARSGAISMSLASDPVVLYRTLLEVSGEFDRSGYALFDHQLGAEIQPAVRFEAFMQQFASQWDTQPAFDLWLQTAVGPSPASPVAKARAKPKGSQSSAVSVVVLVLVLLWGLVKLREAGYF